MPTHKYLTGLTAMAFLLALSATASGQTPTQTIYKWTDENGVVHYDMRKPTDPDASVDVIKQKRTEPKDFTSSAATPATNAAANPADGKTAAEEAPPAKDPQICEKAKANLLQLQNRRQVSVADEYGNERILDESEVQDQIKRAQDAVQANCD
ncbi:MAG TPA: DUF4124 domain-containing protein [Pseudomonadales bacterium]